MLCDSPSSNLCVRLGYYCSVMCHAAMLMFFPKLHSDVYMVLERSLAKLTDPTMDQVALISFYQTLVDATLGLMRVVRLMSTKKEFPLDVLLTSHVYVDVRNK